MTILSDLDLNARTSLTVPGEIRSKRLEAIQAVTDRDGTFDAGRVNEWLADRGFNLAGPECGSTTNALVSRGIAVWTGRVAELGNTKNRNAHRLVKVYRLTRRVWDDKKGALV